MLWLVEIYLMNHDCMGVLTARCAVFLHSLKRVPLVYWWKTICLLKTILKTFGTDCVRLFDTVRSSSHLNFPVNEISLQDADLPAHNFPYARSRRIQSVTSVQWGLEKLLLVCRTYDKQGWGTATWTRYFHYLVRSSQGHPQFPVTICHCEAAHCYDAF